MVSENLDKKKLLEEYMEKAGHIDKAEGFLETVLYVLDFFIEDLKKEQPDNKYELPSLRISKEYLEDVEGDFDG